MKPTEYVFVDHDGGVHFDIVIDETDVWQFVKLHNAKLAMPLSAVPEYEAGDQPFTCPHCGARTDCDNGLEICPDHGLFNVTPARERVAPKPKRSKRRTAAQVEAERPGIVDEFLGLGRRKRK